MLSLKQLKLYFLVFFVQIWPSLEHARLMEPPSRASMWRLGFPTPVDQDDNQSYCGGFGVQYDTYGGLCGICGDPWGQNPRAHEAPGGIYATGIIGKSYRQGSYIPIIVDITANHQGYIEFKICPNNDVFVDPEQSCFDSREPLWVSGGDPILDNRRYPIYDYETGLRLIYAKLPMDLTCKQCIIQFTYVAGNNWGKCEDGITAAVGCGPQETFRGCADIEIVSHPLLSALSGSSDDSIRNEQKEEEAVFISEPIFEKDIPDYEPSFNEDLLENTSSSTDEEDVVALRRKKTLLERVMKRLRELIIASQPKVEKEDDYDYNEDDKKSGWKYWDMEPVTESYDNHKSLELREKPRMYLDTSSSNMAENEVSDINPWWERIISNRH